VKVNGYDLRDNEVICSRCDGNNLDGDPPPVVRGPFTTACRNCDSAHWFRKCRKCRIIRVRCCC